MIVAAIVVAALVVVAVVAASDRGATQPAGDPRHPDRRRPARAGDGGARPRRRGPRRRRLDGGRRLRDGRGPRPGAALAARPHPPGRVGTDQRDRRTRRAHCRPLPAPGRPAPGRRGGGGAAPDGETRAMLEAYAAGINAIIDSPGRLPVEFALLRMRPQRWSPVDSIVCAKLLALGLSLNWDSELQRLRLVQEVGPDIASRLALTYPDSNPTILAATLAATPAGTGDSLLAMYQAAARWLPSPVGASNAWAVAPRRTSHRPGDALQRPPPRAHAALGVVRRARPRRRGLREHRGDVGRAALPDHRPQPSASPGGTPTPSLTARTWSSSSSTRPPATATAPRPAGSSHGWPARSSGSRTSPDAVEEVVITRHGPVVERCDDVVAGRWLGLALQWTALTPGVRVGDACSSCSAPATGPPSAAPSRRSTHPRRTRCTRTSTATSATSATAASRCARGPAVRPAHAGLGRRRAVGALPHRRRGAAGARPARRTGDHRQQPHRRRRPSRTTSPTTTWPGTAPCGSRSCSSRDRLDTAYMRAAQMDLVSPPAVAVARLLEPVRCTVELAEAMRLRLVAWDGRMAPDRVEPTVYEAFMRRLAEHALRPLCGDAWGIAAGFDLVAPRVRLPGEPHRPRDADAGGALGGRGRDPVRRPDHLEPGGRGRARGRRRRPASQRGRRSSLALGPGAQAAAASPAGRAPRAAPRCSTPPTSRSAAASTP